MPPKARVRPRRSRVPRRLPLAGRNNLPRALRSIERGCSLRRKRVISRRTEDHGDRAGRVSKQTDREIRGTGYVVQSLEAALWCFYRTDTFETAILKAANLGDDTDTTAAVCGQVAGAYYGESGIPQKWLVVVTTLA